MNKRRVLVWGGTAVAVVAVLAWAFAPRPVPVETAVVMTGHFEESIEEDARTRVRDRYTVSVPVASRLVRIVLREGDRVAAGDTVAELLPALPSMIDERSAREAAARLAAARAGVQRAGAAVERARIAVDEARIELDRNERLARDGFVSGARLDTLRLALQTAQRGHEAARAEREMALQEQAQAAAVLQPVGQARTGQPLPVRAPIDGVVLRIAQQSEATLVAGTPLLEIGDPARMEVVAELLTTDAVQARPGRRVVIERWGGPPVEGVVRRVEPAAFTKVSALGVEEQRVKVLIDLQRPPEGWQVMGDGFRVTARIVTQSVDRAVLVPVGALFPFADGGLAAYRIDGGRARLQPVEVAGRNGSEAWVREGLQPGQSVIVYPPPSVSDGQRVQVRKP
ncbi:efflux RND transporter periplasmic adaptor subunit [Ramlibacter sp. AW1]|uniref:Efflux RND transporter periplasmic adaptor subunit n=1 Tax=Ramlibacter aurantiacus TaxID=2801330 RepID=A0A936ZKQ4_9BURK|nr:efflux RND transporter periplasmic adaptor subunit [Ramlibacter aurantiacus]MBL0419005.1 efflux RND transporter periplasmic adaptor subunit [Ramlibacter aurantiacus]